MYTVWRVEKIIGFELVEQPLPFIFDIGRSAVMELVVKLRSRVDPNLTVDMNFDLLNLFLLKIGRQGCCSFSFLFLRFHNRKSMVLSRKCFAPMCFILASSVVSVNLETRGRVYLSLSELALK